MVTLDELLQELKRRYGDRKAWRTRLQGQMALHGISQFKLAVRAGLDPANFSKYLLGNRDPRLEMMLRIDYGLQQLIHDGRNEPEQDN